MDSIDILYKNKETEKQFVKKVKVEYDWKPPICLTCKVFGHSTDSHKKTSDESNVQETRKEDEGFISVDKRKENAKEGNMKAQQNKSGQHMERRNMVPKPVYRRKSNQEEKATQTQATQATQNRKDNRKV